MIEVCSRSELHDWTMPSSSKADSSEDRLGQVGTESCPDLTHFCLSDERNHVLFD